MKKVMSIVSVCLVLTCVMAMAIAPVSAATPKEEIMAKAKELIPVAYQAEYLPMVENVLQQIDVSSEQAAAVIADMEAAAAAIEKDKGNSLSNYSEAERAAVLAEIDDACTTLGLSYEIVPAENPTHEGDMNFILKDQNGDKIANIDPDVKKTGSAVDCTMVVAAIGLAALAIVAGVYGKKLAAAR